MAMSFMAFADDFPLKQFQRGEQRGRPVALVVVRHGAATALLEGQAGLGAVQSLNLALFIDTKNDGLVGRIEIEADNIGQFFEKLRIARQLERLRPMRFEVVALPDAVHRGLADALRRRQRAATPVSRSFRLRSQSRIYNRLNLLRSIRRLAASPWGHLPQGSTPSCTKRAATA